MSERFHSYKESIDSIDSINNNPDKNSILKKLKKLISDWTEKNGNQQDSYTLEEIEQKRVVIVSPTPDIEQTILQGNENGSDDFDGEIPLDTIESFVDSVCNQPEEMDSVLQNLLETKPPLVTEIPVEMLFEELGFNSAHTELLTKGSSNPATKFSQTTDYVFLPGFDTRIAIRTINPIVNRDNHRSRKRTERISYSPSMLGKNIYKIENAEGHSFTVHRNPNPDYQGQNRFAICYGNDTVSHRRGMMSNNPRFDRENFIYTADLMKTEQIIFKDSAIRVATEAEQFVIKHVVKHPVQERQTTSASYY